MPTGISGLYKNTKCAKEAEKRNKERERLVELISQFERTCPENCTGLEKSCTQCVLEQKADHLLANGVRVEILNNSVSLINGHIDEGVKK